MEHRPYIPAHISLSRRDMIGLAAYRNAHAVAEHGDRLRPAKDVERSAPHSTISSSATRAGLVERY